jgi:putative FmdB family regulatory protein
MPVYVYLCGECGERAEYEHGMDEQPGLNCIKCGGELRDRVPQRYRWYKNPDDVLHEDMDREYREWRSWRKKTPAAPDGVGGAVGIE